MNTPVPPSLSRETAALLRQDLVDWTVDSLTKVIGERAQRAFGREQVLPALLAARAAGSDPRAILTRAFLLGDAVTRTELASALPSFGVERAEQHGLVQASGHDTSDQVQALVDLRPYAATDEQGEAQWWVSSDQGEAVLGGELREEHVLGIGGASLTLAALTVRNPVQSMLDLGTGCGVQALHGSRHARRTVATDISTRALAFAQFNQALNSVDSWELREGSMLEPVNQERFDLIVSNPPFVIAPQQAPQYEYRSSGAQGDAISARLVAALPRHLNEGGVAQLLANWEIRDTWQAAVEEWVAAQTEPVDVWIVQRDQLDPAEYAETWLRDAGLTPDRDPQKYRQAYETYLRDFDARGVAAIGFGLVTLRKPESGRATTTRYEELTGQLPQGTDLARALAAQDALASMDDDALMSQHYIVASDVTEERYTRPGDEHPQHIILRQGGGFGRSLKVDTAVAGLVSACDGELSIGQIVHALASLLDIPVGQLSAGILPVVRELVTDGFFTPA